MAQRTKQTAVGIRLLLPLHLPQLVVCAVLDYNASPMTHVRLDLVWLGNVLLPHAAMVYSTRANHLLTAVAATVHLVQLTFRVQSTPIANLHCVVPITRAHEPTATTMSRTLKSSVSIVEARAACVVPAIRVCTVLIVHLTCAPIVLVNRLLA